MSRSRVLTVFACVLVLGTATWSFADGPDPNKGMRGAAFTLAVPFTTITSAGPLTDIFVGAEASTQIAHVLDGSTYQVYPPGTTPGDYGTFIVVADALYAPDFANHDGSATGSIGPYTPFTMVSQTPVMGSGTSGDPFYVTTIVDVGMTGLQLEQTDIYVIGQETYRTHLDLMNTGDTPIDVILYRAFDCYLQASDDSYGMQSGSSVGCSENPNNVPFGRIEQLLPITPGNNYYQANYSEVWSAIGTHLPFNDTCRCDELIDTGAGISWSATVPAGSTSVFEHDTVFSPSGVVGAAAVPTLSGIGIVVFIGLMAFLGVATFYLRR